MRLLLAVTCALPLSCSSTGSIGSEVRIAHLGREGGDATGFAALGAAFSRANPGYAMEYRRELTGLAPAGKPRVLFIQEGEGAASVRTSGSLVESAVAVGDVLLVRAGERLVFDAGVSALVFEMGEDLPKDLPAFVRPDWDPSITDTPGGCAEETGAYRRILLTWLDSVGPYVYHGLNAHRVRITDSFSHYHPVDGGFDELYLVQMVQPGARLLTSEHVDLIESPASVTREQTADLIASHDLAVGDLVYLPRGTMHRGLGGVLAQVITVPGFRPGAEIGVDHHLRAIEERLGLGLPYHESASQAAVVK